MLRSRIIDTFDIQRLRFPVSAKHVRKRFALSSSQQSRFESPDQIWLPAASVDMLRFRAQLLQRVRAFFDARGFFEVETPLLSADIVVDRHLDPFVTTLCDDPRRPDVGQLLYLQTSPEFAMKRLLAAGAQAIYQVTRAFRNSERGSRHNPEFTMVEWYRQGDGLHQGIDLLAALTSELLGRAQVERISYADAFLQTCDLQPHLASVLELADACCRLHINMPTSMATADRDVWLDLLLTEIVEPWLARRGAVIVFDYPPTQAALARLRTVAQPAPHEVAERFELYVDGVELANGYHELLDPAVLRARNATANRQRAADGKPLLPEESRLLAAMDRGLPASSGVALGFDRLVMVAAKASSIAEVMAFPIDRA